MQFVPLGEIPITKTKAYSVEKQMQTFLHSALPKIFSEKPSSSRRAKKPSKNKKSKKKYLSRRKHRRKSTSTRSKRTNDYSSENKSIRKHRKNFSSHGNAISTHPVSHDQQLENQETEPKNPQEITQINQQVNEHLPEYEQENYSNPAEYINKNPIRHMFFQPNHQYQQTQHNYQHQQQNDLTKQQNDLPQKFSFTKQIVTTFGTLQKDPNSNAPILTLSQIKLFNIAQQLTPRENTRNQRYHNNSDHAQHNYVNPNSQHMYRCPTAICQYQILNPQNIRTSILQHCENYHKNNILKYKYTDDTTNDWIYVHYPPNN